MLPDILKGEEGLQRKWAYSGRYPLKELAASPEAMLKQIMGDANLVIAQLSNDGAVMFELQAVNLIDRELNPDGENVFVRVLGFRRKPPE